MKIRFADLVDLHVPSWVLQLFCAEPTDVELELQEQFIDLQSDDESRLSFKEDRYDLFWCQVASKYPLLWKEAIMWVISFPTSYLVEKGFSAVTLMLSKQRNRLSITKRGNLLEAAYSMSRPDARCYADRKSLFTLSNSFDNRGSWPPAAFSLTFAIVKSFSGALCNTSAIIGLS